MFTDSRLNIFMTILDEGSFTAAARKLGISQPAVSQNIAEIEKAISAQLFERTKGNLHLTEDGKRFKEYAEQILYWYAAAERSFGNAITMGVIHDISKRRPVKIGVSDRFECHLVPSGTPNTDLEITEEDGHRCIKLMGR